jgi:hypothetical protein
MPDLNPQLVVCPPLQTYFIDKDTGAPMSGGKVTFYEDNNRSVKKSIYQLSEDPSNNFIYTELDNPLTLSSIGTFVDESGNNIAVYLFPFVGTPDEPTNTVQLYFIRVENSDGIFQYSVPAWPSGVTSPLNPTNVADTIENFLLNPQFVDVSFNNESAYTFNVSGTTTTQVAPDWKLLSTGSGTIVIEQVATADITIPSNPSYVLDIDTTGMATNVILYQRLEHTPRLLANEYASGYFDALSLDGTAHLLKMIYSPSNGSAYTIISQLTSTGSSFTSFTGTVKIDGTINTDPATTGYIDIQIVIPPNAHIQITSIQLSQVNDLVETTLFQQQTTPYQETNLWHFYRDSVILQAKNSVLTGWDFGTNPWQFSPTPLTNFPYIPGNIGYAADQTIIYSEVANSIQVGKISGNECNYLIISARPATTQGNVALIQYIDPSSSATLFNNKMSSLVKAQLNFGNSGSVNLKARLIYRSGYPSTISATEPISGWSGGDPIFSAGWSEVIPLNDPVYSVTSSTANIEKAFDSFKLPPAGANNNQTIGIVIYFSPLNLTNANQILFKSASLVTNEFAIESDILTFDDSLRRCQFYYEKSYDNNVMPGTALASSYITAPMQALTEGANYRFRSGFFGHVFSTVKCINPTVTLYSLTIGNANQVSASMYYLDGATLTQANADVAISPDWVLDSIGTKSFSYNPTLTNVLLTGTDTSPALPFVTASIRYHYTADSRLGV